MNSDYVYEKKQRAKRNRKIKKYKKIVFYLTMVVLVFSICFYFLLSDDSKVYHYSIKGNKLLTKSYLKKHTGIKENDSYFFTFDFAIENKLKKNKFIKSVDVQHKPYNIIEISIEERKIFAYFVDDKEYFISVDKEFIEVAPELEYLKYFIPKAEGFSKQEMLILADYFSNLDFDIISEISEIIKYPFTFDQMNLQLILRDGNNVFASKEALNMLKEIHSVVSNIKKQPSCIFFDELTSTAFTSKCPWEKKGDNPIEENSNIEKGDTSQVDG